MRSSISSTRRGERPRPVRQEHAQRYRRDRHEVRAYLADAGHADEEEDEQTRRDRAGRLDGDIEHPRPPSVPRGEGPGAVEDVAVHGADGERERSCEHVPRSDREQQPVDDEAEQGVAEADDQEADELARRVLPAGHADSQRSYSRTRRGGTIARGGSARASGEFSSSSMTYSGRRFTSAWMSAMYSPITPRTMS